MTKNEVPFNIVQYKYLKTKYVLLEYSIDVNYKVIIINHDEFVNSRA